MCRVNDKFHVNVNCNKCSYKLPEGSGRWCKRTELPRKVICIHFMPLLFPDDKFKKVIDDYIAELGDSAKLDIIDEYNYVAECVNSWVAHCPHKAPKMLMNRLNELKKNPKIKGYLKRMQR